MTTGRCDECGVLWHEPHKMSCSQRWPTEDLDRSKTLEELRGKSYEHHRKIVDWWAKRKKEIE